MFGRDSTKSLKFSKRKHFLFALWGKRPVVSSQWKAPRYGGFFAALF